MDVLPGMEIQKHNAHKAWRAADRVRRLSDRLVGIGPFGIGLDGVLAWIPGVGPFYSLAAGGVLMVLGLRGGASPASLIKMAGFLVADTASSAVPVAGWAVDTFFPGHLLAAQTLQKDIESRHGLPSEIAAQRRKKRPVGRRGRKPLPSLKA
jgi:hypothetical protein